VLVWVQTWPFPGDEPLYRWANSGDVSTTIVRISRTLDGLSEPSVAVLTVVLLAIVVARRIDLRAALFVVGAAGVVLVVDALKAVIGSTDAWVEITHTSGSNFPSGHAAYATAVLGAAAWLASGRRNLDVRIALIVIISLAGLARVALAVHLLSDVIAGHCVGLAWLILVRVALYKTPLLGWGSTFRG
jgi:membrane-associated phospholipid phosphatase